METSRPPGDLLTLLSDFVREDTVKDCLVPNGPESWSCGNDSFGKRPEYVSRPSPEASDTDIQTSPSRNHRLSVPDQCNLELTKNSAKLHPETGLLSP